jgi:hypothetical protein
MLVFYAEVRVERKFLKEKREQKGIRLKERETEESERKRKTNEWEEESDERTRSSGKN